MLTLIYLNMNSCKKGNPWSVKLLALLIFDIQFTFCRKANVSFQVESIAKLGNNVKKAINYTIPTGTKKSIKGTVKSTIPSRLTDVSDTFVDKHDGNLVFYQSETNEKKNESRRKTPILFKSSPKPNNSPSVGDGLDLARASILPRKSSPSTVTSCIGNQVTLKCAAEGNPAPEFTWYKGKQTVGREKVAEFDLTIAPSLFTRASHLTLTPNDKDDFGEYECAASNSLGATQHSTHRILLSDKGEPICTQSTYNKDRKKYNSIIIGTVSAVVMLLALLCIAGFVFWRLNQQEATSYQRLKTSSTGRTETLQEGDEGTVNANRWSTSNDNEGSLNDDFNAKEIGRLSSVLAGEWERLARLVGFHQHDINTIRDNSDRIESRCAEMLNRFRRRRGSRETLAESVEEMKDIHTASAIRQKYYQSNPID